MYLVYHQCCSIAKYLILQRQTSSLESHNQRLRKTQRGRVDGLMSCNTVKVCVCGKKCLCCVLSHSVVSDSLQPHGL